jgi:hypothetical protein
MSQINVLGRKRREGVMREWRKLHNELLPSFALFAKGNSDR